VELCALGFELLGIFFRSLFAGLLSPSPPVGGLLKKPETFRSLAGVASSGCSPSNLSLLVTAEACCDNGVLEFSRVTGAALSDEGMAVLFEDGTAGDRPRGAVA
jgi:hypothetical protein